MKEEELKKWAEIISDVWSSVVAPLGEEYAAVEKLIRLNDQTRGRVLSCALVLEHLVDRYMKEHKLNLRKDRHPLNGKSFAEKLDLLAEKADEDFSRSLIEGIKLINTIRNKYAHKLDYQLNRERISILASFNSDDTEPPIDPTASDYAARTIENYTRAATAYLLAKTGKGKAGIEGLYQKYPGMKRLVDTKVGDIFSNEG
jgi:hypothetical protein